MQQRGMDFMLQFTDMKAKALVKKYVHDGRVMQLATQSGGQPWVASVYYVEDDDLNLYWLSLPTRRHSQEIQGSPKVSIAIAVKLDQPVIGIQAKGSAVVINNRVAVAKVMQQYIKKYGLGKDFYSNFIAGKNQHSLYKFSPQKIVLFDEVNFKDDPRIEMPVV